MEATLFGPKVEAEAYRFMQQRLTNAGYSPAEIDKILDVLGYSMPADGLVYAPQPTEVLP